MSSQIVQQLQELGVEVCSGGNKEERGLSEDVLPIKKKSSLPPAFFYGKFNVCAHVDLDLCFINGNEPWQVTNMLPPRELADLYRSSRLVYFPMATVGGKCYGAARRTPLHFSRAFLLLSISVVAHFLSHFLLPSHLLTC